MGNMNKFGQRGTLLMEAIAMLGLIAMVTPTLYKKSAERMQEIQDINVAGQARVMNNIINTFVKQNKSKLNIAFAGTQKTWRLCENDNEGGDCFDIGYSSFVPGGYSPENMKGYNTPRVYLHQYNEKNGYVYYIIYPATVSTSIGSKRATRVASLVGSNGGTMMTLDGKFGVYGTGGGWVLDSSSINDLNIANSALVENSLVITSPEPIVTEDDTKYLYRIDEPDAAHNTMLTDLYMGGHDDLEYNGDNQFYSIFNVRKLTLNTKCRKDNIKNPSVPLDDDCPANVADLYIGKPVNEFSSHLNAVSSNTGAAWIYGNLSALNESFKLIKGASDEDVSDEMMFGRYSSGTSSDVLYAINTEGSAKVAMLNDFVQAQESSGVGNRKFLVGSSGVEDAFIGVYEGSSTVRINSPDNNPGGGTTYINAAGGTVYIGDRGDSDPSSQVYINNAGGLLSAGSSGSWIYASGEMGGSSAVHVLKEAGTGDLFTVGGDSAGVNYMMRADSSAVGLRGGRIQVVERGDSINNLSTNGGGLTHLSDSLVGVDTSTFDQGQTAILTKFTDITGHTYMGPNLLQNFDSVYTDTDTAGSLLFSREQWDLAIAGSAYIDSTLAANEAWFKSAGFKELHTGLSSLAEFKADSTKAMLNVYKNKLVVRNRQSNLSDDEGTFGAIDESGSLIYIDNSSTPIIRLQTTKGAAFELKNDEVRLGSGMGSSEIMMNDSQGVYIRTKNDSSYAVNVQNSAMVFTGEPGDMINAPTNKIVAKTGSFAVRTMNNDMAYSTGTGSYGGAQFYVDSSTAAVRQVDFRVITQGEAGSTMTFYVAPRNYDLSSKTGTTDTTGTATVNVDGSLHVKGNRVIHIASDDTNTNDSADVEKRSIFEVDPNYVQVLGRDSSGSFSFNGSPYAMIKVNPFDVKGDSSQADDTLNTGVYIRRGAIEMAQSDSSLAGGSTAADAGFGYILANRMVSNAGKAVPALPTGMVSFDNPYDQYMVNPAYTSVMHDIKLTTRGGARLSDVLPDYVLKDVYNLSNNCVEGTVSGVSCENAGMDKWAAPYVGIIPYAPCPPGYLNMTTLMPISFNVGRAGRLVQEERGGATKWVIGGAHHQAELLKQSGDLGNIIYPAMEEVNTFVYNGIAGGGSAQTFDDFSSWTDVRKEGWFLGAKAIYQSGSTVSDSKMSSYTGSDNQSYWKYASNGTDWKTVAEPLYFQQNTWLKTTVDPDEDGWKAYMGFIYDVNEWGTSLGGVIAPVGNIFKKDGSSNTGLSASDFRWNVFPVPINTIEGHAMVYCFFDRKNFSGWGDLVDQIDQLGSLKANDGNFRDPTNIDSKPDEYKNRLNDPTLKYKDPW